LDGKLSDSAMAIRRLVVSEGEANEQLRLLREAVDGVMPMVVGVERILNEARINSEQATAAIERLNKVVKP